MIQGRRSRTSFVISTALLFITGVAQADRQEAVLGEYLVKLKPSESQMSTFGLERSLGAKIKRVVNAAERVILVQRPTVEVREAAISSLQANRSVVYAEPNYIYHAVGGTQQLPNDPEFTRLWGLLNSGQVTKGEAGEITGTPGLDIDVRRAWQIETGSRQVVVAVIDTGVDYKNADLAGNMAVNQAELNGQPAVDDDSNGYVDDIYGYDFVKNNGDPMDVFGHGTHVSGTIGAVANNGVGVVGVAWNVRLMALRFLGDDGSGTLADAVSAIDYATKARVNIMSNSWGGGGFSQTLLDAINRAKEAGILFVVAAGNEANNNDKNPSYPASYDLDNIVSVAAVDATGALADFSNFGAKSVHLAAPGVNIVSYTTKGLESWSGTSMATPHVSGVATLLLSQDLSQSYHVIKQRLLNSTRPLGGLRGKVSTGGMVNAYYALTNQVAPPDENDPFLWKRDPQMLSSAHPYENNAKQSWTLHVDGAKQIAVHFSRFETESNYDKVSFTDGNGKVVRTISGRQGELFGPIIDGDTVTITLTSDKSYNRYGFDIDGIAFR